MDVVVCFFIFWLFMAAGSVPSEDLLPYTTLVLKESLRLSPPASTARWAGPGTTVTTSKGITYDISNSVCYIPVAVIQRDPEVMSLPVCR